MEESKFFQDNQSTMKLEMNRKRSSGQKTRHVDIHYFFIKDRIASEGIDIINCPTEEMLANFFMKLLQGSLFKKFREVIMGRKQIGTLKKILPLSPPQERVENEGLAGNIWPSDNGVINYQPLIKMNKMIDGHESYVCVCGGASWNCRQKTMRDYTLILSINPIIRAV